MPADSDSSEEYQPSHEGSEANSSASEDLDEEELLRQHGARSGRGNATSDEERGGGGTTEEEEEDEQDLFNEQLDPLSLLDGMHEVQHAGDAGQQPYEVLAARKRAARRELAHVDVEVPGPSRSRGGAFGATVEEIWDVRVAEQMRLGPSSSKGRRAMRGRQRRQRRAAAKGVRQRGIPEDVARRLGEANLLYASGDYEPAIALLLEVIQSSPNLPDPYHTLGLLYEQVGEPRKALDFYMIAAHLTPKDVTLWHRLATLSTELGFVRQAIYCLGKVIARDKEDLDARWDRAVLYQEVNEHRRALAGFNVIAEARPADGEVVKYRARLHHKLGQAERAVGLLEAYLGQFPNAADLTHINMLAELYMEAGRFADAADLIQRAEARLCAGPGVLPVDLTVKLGQCTAMGGDVQAAIMLLRPLLAEHESQFADLFVEVGDFLLLRGEAAEALRFFEHAKVDPAYDTPALWDKMAQCQTQLGRREDALGLYQTVVDDSSAPAERRLEAALALAELHDAAGRQDAALQALADAPEAGLTEVPLALMLRRAELWLRLGRPDMYLEVVQPVATSTLRQLTLEADASAPGLDPNVRKALRRRARLAKSRRAEAERGTIFTGFVTRDRRKPHVRKADEEAEAIAAATDTEAEPESRAAAPGFPDILRNQEDFDAFLRMLRVMLDNRQPRDADTIATSLMQTGGKRFADRANRDSLRMVQAEAAMALGDASGALGHLKAIEPRWPASNAIWNLHTRAMAAQGVTARMPVKLLGQLRERHPTSVPVRMLLGHASAGTGTAACARQYMAAQRLAGAEPLPLLCLGVAQLTVALSKKVPDRDRAVLTAFALLQEYSARRRNPQEAAYNLGRAAHQLGLLHLAVPFYERALDAPPPDPAPGSGSAADAATQAQAQALCLKREAAHNLALLYRATGAPALARQVMRQHLIF
ncbi:hypothetical protein WJX81_006772 [Elliptochloris bilobata]|uniref:General transcription factor 3C polypeptide 3 n=1 Tax=Elliptochloris bilobata TaxID=381761 RepID=A0AAW1SEW2_9CHLO